MSQVIVIRWEPGTLRAMVVCVQSARAELLGEFSVAWDPTDNDANNNTGRQLAEALAPFTPSRSTVVVAVAREILDWQHLTLPPCPDEDLPDLVRLQADYSPMNPDDPTGLDYLPLVGDTETPYCVWAISLDPTQLVKLQRVLGAAELCLGCLVPLVLGWPAWARHTVADEKQSATINVAAEEGESAIWATLERRLVLFRQLYLPQTENTARTATIAGELRRTLLTFAQEQPAAETVRLQLVGADSTRLNQQASELSKQLGQSVRPLSAASSDENCQASLPALGLALDEAAGIAPLVDLAHPRRRSAPRTSRRTYALAAVAALALVTLIGLQGYQELHAPLEAAATAQAEIDLLEKFSDLNRKREQQASAIRDWLANSVNLLAELRTLSTHVRPEPLAAEPFPVEDDVVLAKVELQSKQFVIDALAKENSDVQPVEYRLRDGVHRVRRGKTQRSEVLPGYPLSFQAIVDVDPEEGTEP